MVAAVKRKMIDDPSALEGPEKAAVILMALGEEQAALWEMMDEEEIRIVSQAMATLGNVSSQAVEKADRRFLSARCRPRAPFPVPSSVPSASS